MTSYVMDIASALRHWKRAKTRAPFATLRRSVWARVGTAGRWAPAAAASPTGSAGGWARRGEFSPPTWTHVIGGLKPERSRELLRLVRARIADGGRLLMVGQWTDATGTQPRFVALLSGTFLLGTSGEAYRVDEIREWLADTGWCVVEQGALTGESTLLVAEAV